LALLNPSLSSLGGLFAGSFQTAAVSVSFPLSFLFATTLRCHVAQHTIFRSFLDFLSVIPFEPEQRVKPIWPPSNSDLPFPAHLHVGWCLPVLVLRLFLLRRVRPPILNLLTYPLMILFPDPLALCLKMPRRFLAPLGSEIFIPPRFDDI